MGPTITTNAAPLGMPIGFQTFPIREMLAKDFEGTLRKMARRLAESFCGGSTAALIAHLLRTEKLSEDDIRALQAIADEKLQNSAAAKKTSKK